MTPTTFVQFFAADLQNATVEEAWHAGDDCDAVITIGTAQIRIMRLTKDTAEQITKAFAGAKVEARKKAREAAA